MILTLFLIVLNLLVTLAFFQKDRHPRFLFFPYLVAQGKGIPGLLYSQFSHSGWSHLLFNMITLFFFGRVMEEASPEAFLLAYFLGAVGADLATFAMHYRDPEYATLGASGAVAGVLFASIVFFPEQSIIIFPIPVPIPGPLFAILYIVGSIYMARNEHRSVNHEAHIGGAVVGFIVGALMAPYGLNRLVDYVGNFF